MKLKKVDRVDFKTKKRWNVKVELSYMQVVFEVVFKFYELKLTCLHPEGKKNKDRIFRVFFW